MLREERRCRIRRQVRNEQKLVGSNGFFLAHRVLQEEDLDNLDFLKDDWSRPLKGWCRLTCKPSPGNRQLA